MCIIFKGGCSQKIENSRKMISFDLKIITEECYNLYFTGIPIIQQLLLSFHPPVLL